MQETTRDMENVDTHGGFQERACSLGGECKRRTIFWISSKCFTSSHNYENFANLKRTI